MAKGKRGFEFTIRKLESLVKAVEELVPISNTELERVWDRHVALYPKQDRTMESLKRKFQEMARSKIKTGDPNMPPHICGTKWAYYTIVKKTDGSTGGRSNDSFFKARDNNSNLDEEESEDGEEWGEVRGKGFDFKGGTGEDYAGDTARDGERGTSLGVDPTNLFGGVVAGVEGTNGPFVTVDGPDGSGGVAATASTASTGCTTISSGRGKQSSGASTGGGQKRKARHLHSYCGLPGSHHQILVMRVKMGTLFGNMMYMKMMQNQMDNKQREQQHKSNSEQREREYQLR
jgi:hypothetical protein